MTARTRRNVVLLAKKDHEEYGLLSILNVPTENDLQRKLDEGRLMASRWHEDFLRDHDILVGTVNASECNNCKAVTSWRTFRKS